MIRQQQLFADSIKSIHIRWLNIKKNFSLLFLCVTVYASFSNNIVAQINNESASVLDIVEAVKWQEDLHYMAHEMPKHKNPFHTMTRRQFDEAVIDTLRAFDGRQTLAERRSFDVREFWQGDSVNLSNAYLRLPATTSTPGTPIVFLMGGPGVPASIIARIPPYFTLFEQLRTVADVILVDQRGTGFSTPNIDCEHVNPPHLSFLYSIKDLSEALVNVYAPCVSFWRAQGVAPELFGVSNIAQDIESIRAQLGTERLSLLGFSYGTRIALEYARLFPDRVDLIALQGVLGFEHGVRLPPTLDSLFARICKLAMRDSIAQSLVPDMASAFTNQVLQLTRNPIVLPIHNIQGDTVMINVGAEGFLALISNRLADPRLPALLATLSQNDTRVLSIMVEGLYQDLSKGGGSMFGRAVYCSAPSTTFRTSLARELANSSTFHEIFDNIPTSTKFCEEIGIKPGTPPPVLVRLGGKALLIEGSIDDRTPLGNASETAIHFQNATVVTVENGGHELLPASEVQQLVLNFFRSGDVRQEKISWPAPRFWTVEQALKPQRRPGQ